jgi:hypothetical protein
MYHQIGHLDSESTLFRILGALSTLRGLFINISLTQHAKVKTTASDMVVVEGKRFLTLSGHQCTERQASPAKKIRKDKAEICGRVHLQQSDNTATKI